VIMAGAGPSFPRVGVQPPPASRELMPAQWRAFGTGGAWLVAGGAAPGLATSLVVFPADLWGRRGERR
jgi:hypothetical protein